jgi:hypothetical protein
MPTYNHVLAVMLTNFVIVTLLVFSVIGIAVGAGLIVSSARMHRIFQVMNRWVSTRAALKPLEVPRNGFGETVRSYRRSFGASFVVLGAFSAFGLVAKVNAAALAAAMVAGRMRPVAEWLVESLKWFLFVGSVVGVVLGILLLVFPDAVTALENRANRWISSRRAFLHGDDMHMTLDKLVEAHPRFSGWVIGSVSAGAAIYAGLLLLARP